MKNREQRWNAWHSEMRKYIQPSDEELNEILSIKPDISSALDVGCGKGELARRLHDRGINVVGIDLSSLAIEEAKRHSPEEIDFYVMDFEEANTNELGTFDFAVSNLVLAFMEDKRGFFEKVHRLLNQNGLLTVINPVVDNPAPEMPKKLHKISVDKEIMFKAADGLFELASRNKKRTSKHHYTGTYNFVKK